MGGAGVAAAAGMDDDDLLFATPRLVIPRRWRPVDLEPYAAMNADPEVMRHFPATLTRAESDEFARYGDGWYEREGLGLLPVLDRFGGGFLGMCGLHRHRWYPEEVEVGWRLARHAWGHGYATEAASRWLDHGFGPAALPRVISITDPANTRSIAVMRRLGMTVDHRTSRWMDGGAMEVVVYAITREQWIDASSGWAPAGGPVSE